LLRLLDGERFRLKRPLGELFRNTAEAVNRIGAISPVHLIVVGDIVSAEFLRSGLRPDKIVVDFRAMRSGVSKDVREVIESYPIPTLKVRNPAGTITPELRDAMKAEPPVKIIVDGEEDLATIPAVLEAPVGSVVAYGQPNEGVVLVKVSEQKKREFRKLLSLFKEIHSNRTST